MVLDLWVGGDGGLYYNGNKEFLLLFRIMKCILNVIKINF